MVDPAKIAKYDCMTPTTLDYLADCSDAVQMDWQLDVAAGVAPPRYPTMYWSGDIESEPNADRAYGLHPTAFNSFRNNVLAYDMNRPAGTAYDHKPRGSWRIKQIYAISDGGNQIVPIMNDLDVYVKFEVNEPL